MWVECNSTIERIAQQYPVRYSRLRYEDFVKDPDASLSRLGLLGGSSNADATSAQEIYPGWHTVYGNPSRIRTAPIVLRADEQWRERMPSGAASTVSMITAPLLGRYGYNLRVSVGGHSRRRA
jgi:hypothetical protein